MSRIDKITIIILTALILGSTLIFTVEAFVNPSQTPPQGQGAFTYTSFGRVGLGNTQPKAKLDVAGLIRSASNIGAIELWDLNTGAAQSGVLTNLFRISSGPEEGFFRIQRNKDPEGLFLGPTPSVDILVINPVGKVAIGSTTPAYQLDVTGGMVNSYSGFCINGDCRSSWSGIGGIGGGGSGWTESTSTSKIYTTNPSFPVGIGILLEDTLGAKLEIFNDRADDNTLRLRRQGALPGDAATFKVGTDGALVIDADGSTNVLTLKTGNVGIGTTTPVYKLHLVASGSEGADLAMSRFSANVAGNNIYGFKSRGTQALPAIITSGDDILLLRAYGYDGVNNLEAARITMDTGTVVGTSMPGNIKFYTASEAVPSVIAQRMRIDSAGNVGIGTTTPWGRLAVKQTGTGGDPAFIVEDSASPDITPFIIDQIGNVGIGTPNPGQKLTVAGTIESTLGGLKFPDGTTQTTAAAGGIPTGAVMFFNLAACPAGWALMDGVTAGVPNALGRYLVALPAAGTLAGTAGTALGNLAPPTFTGVALPGHSHSVSLPAGVTVTTCGGAFCAPPFLISPGTYTSSGNSAGTPSGSINVPYIQLLACQKL